MAPEIEAHDDPAGTEGEAGEEMQPAELHSGGEGDGDRRRRRRGRRGGRRRRRGPGQDNQAPEQYGGGERGPRLQLELRPGEPGYSGPAEEFGEESDFVAAAEVAETEAIEPVPSNQEAARHEAPTAGESPTPPRAPAKEGPPAPSTASEAEAEAERAPVAYNVSAPHEVSGPAPNPRRGWWRR